MNIYLLVTISPTSVQKYRNHCTINRIKNFVTKKSLKMLSDAMIHSHLVYCINLYGCANSTSLQKLKIKQKEAVRIIANAGYIETTQTP